MSQIPRIIHQIWFQGESNIPSHLQEYHQTWKTLNPEYQIKIWDQQSIENLINTQANDIKSSYHSYPLMIQKIDFAKYIILYVYGGIYIDMDVKCLKPIQGIIDSNKDKEAILSVCSYDAMHHLLLTAIGLQFNEDLINNGIIMCIPQSNVMKSILEECIQSKDTWLKYLGKNFYYIFYTTGPVMMTKAIRKVNKNDLTILNHQYFEACNMKDFHLQCDVPDYAIGLHIYEGSWVSPEEKQMTQMYFFVRQYLSILIAVLIFLVILSVFMYRKKLKF